MKQVHTDKAPAVVGPYSQAIEVNGFVYCSGQIGLDPSTKKLVEGLENQTHQVMKNLQAVLEEAGSDLSKVVKTLIFVTDMSTYAKVNEIYAAYFNDPKPARATVAVVALPAGALVEIECVAVK